MKESLSKPPSGQPQVDGKKEGDEKAAHSADAKAPEDGTNPQRAVTQLGKPQPVGDEPGRSQQHDDESRGTPSTVQRT